MKNLIKKSALVLGIAFIALTGCRKENVDLNSTINPSSESDIEALVTQTDQENESVAIIYDESSNEITASNEGIAADYLISEADLEAETPANSTSASTLADQSFLRCLKSVNPDADQVKKLRIALADYEDCKASVIKRARAIHHDLVLKYRDLAKEQAKLLRLGKITKAEYEARIQRLRHAFKKELRALQLKDKVDAALKDCHAKLLRQIHAILSERQWKAFIDCYRK